MKILEIGLKNFRSYGNTWTGIKLSDKGSLNLLTAKNGQGKSSFIEAFSFAIFGKVKGKKKETVPTADLVNEINGSMETRVHIKSGESVVRIDRTPKTVNYFIGKDDTQDEKDRAGKGNKDKEIENLIGMDFKTYQNFVSLNINYFKNFLSLTTDEKRLIRDKLLNFEQFDELQKLSKKMKSDTKKELDKISASIDSLEYSLSKIQESLQASVEKKTLNKEQRIAEIKTQLSELKEQYNELTAKLEKGKTEVLPKIESQYNNIRTDYSVLKHRVSEIDTQIQKWNTLSDECPTCGSSIDKHKINELVTELEKTKTSLQNEISVINETLKEYSDKLNRTRTKIYDLEESRNEIRNQGSLYKKEMSDLSEDTQASDDFDSSIRDIEKRLNDSLSNKEYVDLDFKAYSEIATMFGDEGIRSMLIKRIIEPLNFYLKKYSNKLSIPFTLYFNEEFDAIIQRRSSDISSEKISDGQIRRANLAILLSYLSIIFVQKPVNVLFLDEVFSSIDVEGIGSIIHIMKDFAYEYNVNVFIVHHSELDLHNFDHVYKVELDRFSTLYEYDVLTGTQKECVSSWVVSIL